MNEKGKNKREWVKNAAIVFLAVMLVLTFFSNTIMNYSLPEVATNYVQSGSITAKIRGTGVIESGDPYEVKVTESRKVASVAVRVGDTVQKGDVLLYLEDAESEELKAAQEALEQAQNAYDLALLTAEVTASDIYSAQKDVSAETLRNQITNAQKALKEAKAAEEPLQEKLKPLEEQKAQLEKEKAAVDAQLSYEQDQDSVAAGRLEPAQNAVTRAESAKNAAAQAKTDAEAALQTATAELTAAQTAAENAWASYNDAVANVAVSGNEAVEAAWSAYDTADQARQTAVTKKAEKQSAYDAAVTALANADKTLSDARTYLASVTDADSQRKASQTNSNLSAQSAAYALNIAVVDKEIASVTGEIEAAQELTVARQEELTELVSQITNVTGLEALLDNIAKAEEQVAELTAKAVDATVTADISGTVTAINVTAGNKTSAADPVAVLQPEGKGYTLSFSVTNEQAKRLSVGDRAELVNSWRYDDVEVTLASIKPDKTDPGQKKMLTFDVTGDVTAGQTLNLSVGQKSANYDLIVPNSAIREDSNGKFILIVESKASPLSTRYIATRVDVEVIASDDTQSAISGGLYGYEYVITTSTKPVEAGKQVRLANN